MAPLVVTSVLWKAHVEEGSVQERDFDVVQATPLDPDALSDGEIIVELL